VRSGSAQSIFRIEIDQVAAPAADRIAYAARNLKPAGSGLAKTYLPQARSGAIRLLRSALAR
jgi:hypothetical protein